MTERNPDPSLLNDLMEMFSDSHIDRLTYRAAKEITRLDADNERLRSQVEALEGERDKARGWVRWLVRQAKDDQLSLKERVGIVAHFPAEEYPPHPAEALARQAQEERDEYRALLIEAGREGGAFLTDTVSLDFLRGVPGQIKALVGSLRAARKASEVHSTLKDKGNG